ncbi:uncharacterized protein toporsb [Clarias gariepinus]|nr:E3 ubiquitin-protein ligase Topors isoform X2 [Clarias gariepinus]
MAPTKMKLRVRKEKPSAKLSQQPQPQQQPLRPETSPDSKCPICLDRFVNVASVERCLHRFCFRCIREWAKNKAECPLCKQPFRSIFHSVRAENDFKEFKVLEDSTASATTSAMTAAAITVPHAGQNSGESTAARSRRPRAARTRNWRGQRTQGTAPSASTIDGVPLDHAALMQRDPACLRQLLPWLRRERVMGTNPSEIRPFLLARTDHILHELVSFARSIEAMQCPPAPSYEEDSGSPSSIINISEDDEDSETAEVTEDTTQDHVLPVPMATSSEISLSQSAWDDETPGPSYSTLSNPPDIEPEENQLTVTATEQLEHRDADDRDDEEECMIVGYVKPMAERTPELVQLSSDSTDEEEEVRGIEAAATETVMKVESSVLSQEQAPLSPKPYPSTSHTERAENMEKSREQVSAGKHSHHKRREHTPRRGFRKPSNSHSGSLSQTSTESSPQSERSVKIGRPHVRSKCREPRRRGHHLLGRSPTIFPERNGSSSEDLVPTRSVPAREKSFSPWDSPGHDGERKRKRRKRRRERETERSRSPHRDSRHRRGNRALWLGSSSLSSSSSDAESRREKPAGKRKYKTRHLERTAHRRSSGKLRKRERERSPSVEIIFERRASDSHSRGRRHKKRSRKKEREQHLSPTVITIDSSDSSSEHAAEPQNRHAEANGHRTWLMDEIDNDHTVDYQDRDDNERITDLSDHTIDYQERLAEFSDRTADDKDRATEARNYIDDYKHHVSDQSRGTVFSDRVAEYKDSVAGVSTQTPDYKDKCTDVGATGYKHSVLKVSDQAAEQREHNAHASRLTAAYKHAVTDGTSAEREDDSKERSGYMAASKHCHANINDRTTDFLESLLDFDESLDDSQDSVTDTRNSRVSDALTLERCLVDVVQEIRGEDEERHKAATPLSDPCFLEELEDSLMGQGHGNNTVGQQEAGLVAHRDQSATEMDNHHVTRDSGVSAEMSPDV